ncbi:unnamed protein product [Spirodela intermedia]|uniref:Uncharacterized protein n=1 Tax=Spirodela intermedia TaxID=51605 RepID=A0A7I8IP04_SPIIN|nr:unnamed protein product [Spirodela intermedia]CAA6659500.1 unnamed protein product [Spirodela intermedia]
MAPGGGGRAISQQAFEDMVRENVEEDLDPEEPRGRDSGALSPGRIVKCVPGVASAKDDPVLQAVDALKEMLASGLPQKSNMGEVVRLLDRLSDLCSPGGEEAGTRTRLLLSEMAQWSCSAPHVLLSNAEEDALVSALKALSCVLCDIRSTEIFQCNHGPKLIMQILNRYGQSVNLLDSCFSVVAAAATGNEIVKEAFMDLKIGELFVRKLNAQSKCCTESMYDAIRILLTPDDDRVLASQVYGYARKFAQIGISDALVEALKDGLHSPGVISICVALKAVAVNDEICRSISEKGGIDAVLKCIVESSEQNDKAIAEVAVLYCSRSEALLFILAGSDSNKNTIVQNGGLDNLIKLSSNFLMIQLLSFSCYFIHYDNCFIQIMTVISALSLRTPENAARAIEAGAGDLAIQAMRKFPSAYQMQKQCCLMIRNLVVRNQKTGVTILLGNGVERLIRKAKSSSAICKEAASAALRDLVSMITTDRHTSPHPVFLSSSS